MDAPASPSIRQRWKPVGVAAPSPSASSSSTTPNDFLQLLTVDFSPLEKRFDEIFARLEVLERHAVGASTQDTSPSENALAPSTQSDVPRVEGADALPPVSGNDPLQPKIDAADLARQLEGLHAAQLRLKIQHELAQSALKVDMESLRRELLVLPQHADLHNFRAEIDVTLTTTLKSLGDQQSLLDQHVEKTLAERELSENQWKAQFEASMDARIQDVWSGLEASQAKVNESVRALEAEMVQVNATTRDAVDATEATMLRVQELEKRLGLQEDEAVAHENSITQLLAMHRQSTVAMETQDAALQSAIDALSGRFEDAETRHSNEQEAYEVFKSDTEKTLQFCTAEITTTIHSSLESHRDKLLAIDGGLTRQAAELKAAQDHLLKHDARLGSLDGRLVQQEKATASLTHALQDLHHEMNRSVGDIHKTLEQAAQDRVAIKRTATELGFTVQEVQQTLQEVSKMAATIELSLTRTAAEIPKLHVLVTTNIANIAKSHQSIADLNQVLAEEKKSTQQFLREFEREAKSNTAKFVDLLQRDANACQGIAQTNATMHQIKHALEESIKYNSNMIHQLNTMVDSLAITESTTDMDDKLARFALQTAELALKLEHFSTCAAGTASDGGAVQQQSRSAKDETKVDLAVMLTKVIRFLGASVAIDYNKYFLTASKLAMPTQDPHTGALVFELPAAHVLEQLRATKVALFVGKMRTFIDQLRPVAQNVVHIHEFRDHLERKIKYVLDFGLANLFPNLGRPRHPNRKLTNVGTCIACDRPLDDDLEGDQAHRHHHHPDATAVETNDPEVEAVEDQKMRRSKLVTSASAGVAHKIDTRTPVRGRSGASVPAQQPGLPGSMFHQTPGPGEYVYRAGFRLPRPATAGGVAKSASAAELAALHSLVVASVATPDTMNIKSTLDDSVSACLEKVALVGKHSHSVATVEIPQPAPSPSPLVRPHTAPLRSRSLPRLDPTLESSTSVRK